MTGRRVAAFILLFVALPLGETSRDRSAIHSQPASQDCSGLRLNEVLPEPKVVDWDGDGTVGPDDEWIELYNAGDTPCDLEGWALDDEAAIGSSPPHVITQTTLIAPGGYIVFYQRETGIKLHNSADSVRLFPPGAAVPIEEYRYYTNCSNPLDRSHCRSSDGPTWDLCCWPTPWRANDATVQCYLPLVSRGG